MARELGDWSAALAALSAQLDEVERRLEADGWGPEDLPSPVPLPVGSSWTAEEWALGRQLLARLQAVTARTEVAMGAVAAELGDLPRRRGAAAAYGGR